MGANYRREEIYMRVRIQDQNSSKRACTHAHMHLAIWVLQRHGAKDFYLELLKLWSFHVVQLFSVVSDARWMLPSVGGYFHPLLLCMYLCEWNWYYKNTVRLLFNWMIGQPQDVSPLEKVGSRWKILDSHSVSGCYIKAMFFLPSWKTVHCSINLPLLALGLWGLVTCC